MAGYRFIKTYSFPKPAPGKPIAAQPPLPGGFMILPILGMHPAQAALYQLAFAQALRDALPRLYRRLHTNN